MLDARIASSLKKIIQRLNFEKWVYLEEEKAQKDDRFLHGRQVAFLIYERFWATGTHVAILGYSDQSGIASHGDDVQGFDTRWDEVLLSTQRVPSDDIPESFYKMRIRGS